MERHEPYTCLVGEKCIYWPEPCLEVTHHRLGTEISQDKLTLSDSEVIEIWHQEFHHAMYEYWVGDKERQVHWSERIESLIKKRLNTELHQRQEALLETIEGMQNDESRFPKDFWNEQEQGAYQILDDLKAKLSEKLD